MTLGEKGQFELAIENAQERYTLLGGTGRHQMGAQMQRNYARVAAEENGLAHDGGTILTEVLDAILVIDDVAATGDMRKHAIDVAWEAYKKSMH